MCLGVDPACCLSRSFPGFSPSRCIVSAPSSLSCHESHRVRCRPGPRRLLRLSTSLPAFSSCSSSSRIPTEAARTPSSFSWDALSVLYSPTPQRGHHYFCNVCSFIDIFYLMSQCHKFSLIPLTCLLKYFKTYL